MIVGAPGSGKSTLARALGERTGLPVRHVDHVHYAPGWVERPRDEKLAMIRRIEAEERWIIEGGLSETWPERVARADALVWLDRSVGLRLLRVARRTWTYLGRTRPDLPDGCPERLNRRSLEFFGYVWRTRKTSREKMRRLHDAARPGLAAFRLRDDRQVAAFVDSCTS